MAAYRSPKALVGVRVPSRPPRKMRYTDEQIFKVGSTYSRHHLKRQLITRQLIPYRCRECRMGDEWNGKKLVLQIDHANGVSNDNRLENLRFICPNCHSQTDTYAGKNSVGMRSKDKVKSNFRAEKLRKDRAKWETARHDPTIAVGTWGWKGRLAERVGISSQKVMKWLTRVDPNFTE